MVDRLMGEERNETDWVRRITLVLAGVAAIVLVYSLLYRWALLAFAGERVSLIHSIRLVVEILTTAGFGGDTDIWEAHDAVALLVIVMNLTAVLLVFVAIPLFAVPLFRDALDRTLPTQTDLEDHVIICGHSAVDDVLRAELEKEGIPYLFVENDPEEVERLLDDGENVIYGDAQRVQTLRNANAEDATALVADLDTETNPTVILSAVRVNPDLHIVSVVFTREAVVHHRYAGADEVVVSKESLGKSLAMRSMKTASERFQEAVTVENGLSFSEYLLPEGSELVGQTIEECELFGEEGITVIGGWFGAKFLISPPPDTVMLENSILLVSGEHEVLEANGARRLPSHAGHPDRVIIAGYGDVGQAATRALQREDITTAIVDRERLPDVDVVGDVTTGETLLNADLENARAIILALDDDPTAIYATIFIKNLCPDIEVIARANDGENVWKLYNAGADYVLSLPSVTGEILASILIEGDSILTPHDEFQFARYEVPGLAGQTLAEADIRNETNCTVVGVERDCDLLTGLGPAFVIEDGDVLVAAGSTTAMQQLEEFSERHGDQ